MMAWMIIFMFLLVGFMISAWNQYCSTAALSQTGTCPGYTGSMATQMAQVTPVFYTFAAITAVFFTIKCVMYPNHKMHVFPKMKR